MVAQERLKKHLTQAVQKYLTQPKQTQLPQPSAMHSGVARSRLSRHTIDGGWRAVVCYAVETDDPWLADLVRRADDGEPIIDTVDFSLEPRALESDFSEDRIEALAEIICRTGEEAAAARQSTARPYSASPGSDRGSRYLRSLS